MAEKYADITIAPNTDEFTMIDFGAVEKLIEIGYHEAVKYREILKEIAEHEMSEKTSTPPSLRGEGGSSTNVQKLPEKIKITEVLVIGNKHLSASAVRDYLGILRNNYYSKDDVYNAFKNAYSTELFDHIYPTIQKDEQDYRLIANVKERDRSRLGINFIYNQHDGLIAGTILNMRNVVLRNSNMWVNLQLGGVNAFEIDYNKYFMREFSLYYRLFPYYREDKFFVYNEDHETIRSYYSREAGMTGGIGFHSFNNILIEPYLYFYRLEFTRHIAEVERFDKAFYSGGSGIKFYFGKITFVFRRRGSGGADQVPGIKEDCAGHDCIQINNAKGG
jgi:hypothetical protein